MINHECIKILSVEMFYFISKVIVHFRDAKF